MSIEQQKKKITETVANGTPRLTDASRMEFSPFGATCSFAMEDASVPWKVTGHQ